MTNSSDVLARNAIERVHLAALDKLGYKAKDWTLEAQLPRFKESCGENWNLDVENFICTLGSRSASRFELIDLIPLYYYAFCDVTVTQRMSSDRQPLPSTPFLIASDPSHDLVAYVNEHGSTVSLEGNGIDIRHVVWVNVGLINFLKALSHHFTWTLARKEPNLIALFDTMGTTEDVVRYIDYLQERRFEDGEFAELVRHKAYKGDSSRRAGWLLPAFGKIDDLSGDMQRMISNFIRMVVTFIVGHEMGHIYLGHTGFHRKINMLKWPETYPLSKSLLDEVEADWVGMVSVWDGFANSTKDSWAVSIDYSWVAPIFFLSAMTGFTLNTDRTNAEKWCIRLFHLARHLVCGLRSAGFEPERVGRIAAALPVLAAATVEWVRRESCGNDASSDHVDLALFEQLKSVCRLG